MFKLLRMLIDFLFPDCPEEVSSVDWDSNGE